MDKTPRYIPLEEMDKLNGPYNEDWDEMNQIRNVYFLQLFKQDLKKAGLKDSTINRHISNVDCLLDMMGSREGYTMEQSINHVNSYLGDWYIRRCLWSTPANIKTTAASIKKFAKSMLGHHVIDQKTYDLLVFTIKENMEDWQQICRIFNSTDEDFTEDDLFDLFDGF